jgi:hypothetical protein
MMAHHAEGQIDPNWQKMTKNDQKCHCNCSKTVSDVFHDLKNGKIAEKD